MVRDCAVAVRFAGAAGRVGVVSVFAVTVGLVALLRPSIACITTRYEYVESADSPVSMYESVCGNSSCPTGTSGLTTTPSR